VDYKYRVEYAHQDDTKPDISGGIHHGTGSTEITTDTLIETQQHKDDVARALGLRLGKTAIAIMAIIPLDTGHVVIDASDYGTDE
jgi:hypothetical protein